ncbi:MAG: hypothetical protein LHW64_10965, partial [Candidatus Cloacimonetes bacterium]|nr:hypothetical protein [Candidatus Cloacimonadota bacterium]MDY0230617.1 hypothetical protein [Candidatus Cloacimonadaceae bacterium]
DYRRRIQQLDAGRIQSGSSPIGFFNWTRDASNPAVPQADPFANTLFIRVNPFDPHNPCDYAFG